MADIKKQASDNNRNDFEGSRVREKKMLTPLPWWNWRALAGSYLSYPLRWTNSDQIYTTLGKPDLQLWNMLSTLLTKGVHPSVTNILLSFSHKGKTFMPAFVQLGLYHGL